MVAPEIAASFFAADVFASRFVVPLMYETKGERGVVGSGALFTHAGLYLLITAKHVLRELQKLEKYHGKAFEWGVPTAPSRGTYDLSAVWTLGDRDEVRADAPGKHVDLAIINLRSPEFLANIATTRTFLSVRDHVQTTTPDGDYYVFGYPLSQTKVRGEHVHCVPFRFATARYAGSTEALGIPYDPVVNLLLHHADRAILQTGEDVPLLSAVGAKGISGSPLWLLRDPAASDWSPETHLKVVGLQTGIIPARCVVGTRWSIVLQAVEQYARKRGLS